MNIRELSNRLDSLVIFQMCIRDRHKVVPGGEAMKRPSLKNALRRLEALTLAAGTLYLTAVTAGSDTAVGAAKALARSSPLGLSLIHI